MFIVQPGRTYCTTWGNRIVRVIDTNAPQPTPVRVIDMDDHVIWYHYDGRHPTDPCLNLKQSNV